MQEKTLQLKYRIVQEQGFSLLEILFTLAIIVFFIGTAAVSFNPTDPRRDLRTEALNVKSLMKLVVDEAIFKRKEIGIKFYEEKIEFLEFDKHNQKWGAAQTGKDSDSTKKSASLDSPLGTYKFPEFIEVRLEMEDVEIFLNPDDEFSNKLADIDPLQNFDEIGEEEEVKPDIYIFSSGELTAFDLEFRLNETEDFVYIISANDIGYITCRAEHEEDELCL